MPNYTDEYLSGQVTIEREQRATADVAVQGDLPLQWRNRLIELRTYIITCQECMQTPDDVFAIKLKAYRDEYEVSLNLAKAAQRVNEPTSAPVLSIRLERA